MYLVATENSETPGAPPLQARIQSCWWFTPRGSICEGSLYSVQREAGSSHTPSPRADVARWPFEPTRMAPLPGARSFGSEETPGGSGGPPGEHGRLAPAGIRSEEHTSELTSITRIAYLVF